MISGYEPNDWFGLAGLAILAIAGMAGAAITARAAHRSVNKVADQVAGVQGGVTAVLDQTQNSHATNMRDDLDEIRDMIKDMRDRQMEHGRDIRGIRTDIGELRGEAIEDRRNLGELEGRISKFVKREHPGAEPL